MSIDSMTDAMAAAAPPFDAVDAARLAERHYGIRGQCELLYGERDLNFRVDGSDGQKHLLKVWNHTQCPDVVDFQMRALDHIAQVDPGLPVPRVIRTAEDLLQVNVKAPDAGPHIACLLSWREGGFVRDSSLSESLKTTLGGILARLDQALLTFRHPAQKRELFWDLSRTDRLICLAEGMASGPTRDLVLETITSFKSRTLPLISSLPHQVIHQDFHLDNVLVSDIDKEKVSGILDFGDALYAPRICELGVACAYQLAEGADPLAGMLPMVRGYHRVSPLEVGETDALAGLVQARLVSSIVITSKMADLHPHNREYLLIDTEAAIDRLHRLRGISLSEASQRLRSIHGT